MRPIDLFSEAGSKAWLTADSQGSSLVLQVHHAACDGKAVLQVLDDFVRIYARAGAGPQSAVELSVCDPQNLPGRGRFGLTLSGSTCGCSRPSSWDFPASGCFSCSGRLPC